MSYDTLARHIAHVWGHAIDGDTLEAARNALMPAAIGDTCEDTFTRSCVEVLIQRRNLRTPGFERLSRPQAEFLASVALELYRTHREMESAREEQERYQRRTCETLIPPPRGA